MVEFRPTPEYWREWSLADHAGAVAWIVLAGAAAGGWIARDLLRAILAGLSSLFLVGGAIFAVNAGFDRSPPRILAFVVRAKEKIWVERSRNSYWDHCLSTATAQGRRFEFSAYVGNITLADWERADPRRGDRVEVEEYPGFLGIPWWKIRGLVTAP